jgi:hypothetical protein
MLKEQKLWNFLAKHLKAIYTGDINFYRQSCIEDLTLYEWFVTKNRIDGLDFHEFMMKNDWAKSQESFEITLLNKKAQIFGSVAVLTYTMLLSIKKDSSITHKSINETRVVAEIEGSLKVVHVHKSPAD